MMIMLYLYLENIEDDYIVFISGKLLDSQQFTCFSLSACIYTQFIL